MVGVRTDGNKDIAMGHIMRCIAIAEKLQRTEKVVFIVSDDASARLLQSKSFDIINLQTDFKNMERELPSLYTNVLKKLSIDRMLIDSYFVTKPYMSEISRYLKTIYIDDLGQTAYDVDMIINYNIFAHDLLYETLYANTRTKCLLGCDYAPLREEFQNIEASFQHPIKNILITTGGTDALNVAGRLLMEMSRMPWFDSISFHVVVGAMNQYVKELNDMAKKNRQIHLHQNVNNMSQLMLSCDMAITAAGSTMYELCACGIPSVCFSIAKNQVRAAKKFGEKGIMINAGDMQEQTEYCIQRIINAIITMMQNESIRMQCYQYARTLLDGNGADKIANEILQIPITN